MLFRSYTELEKRFEDTNLSICCDIRKGSPAHECMAYANSDLTPLDLIAFTTSWESAPNIFGLGSIAQKVISKVSIPVLLVRPPD